MPDFSGFIIALLIIAVIFIVAALPLHISLKLMRARTTILKTVLVSIIAGIAVYVIRSEFGIWGGLIAFLAMLFIYKVAFRIGLLRAFVAWLLQFAVAVALIVVALALGVTIAGINFIF